MLFLGIDSGTQSSKAVVLEVGTGKILATAQEGYGMVPGLPPGHLEQAPADWVRAVDAAVASCCQQLGARRSEIRGIGVSGQQHGMVALDAMDEVVRPAKLWCDTSTGKQCEELAGAFAGAAGLIELAGNAIPPGFTAPKILWLKQNEPENFARTETVLLPHDYLNFWLSGEKRMEYGDASGTGLLDIRKREWCGELIRFIDPSVEGMLPEVGSSRAPHGELRPDLAARWGLGAGVIVSAGGGDNMMGAIGTGNIAPGVITASLWTSGTLFGVAGAPVIDPKGEVAAFCDSTDQWMPLVCTMNVTVMSEQIREVFSWDIPTLERAVSAAAPGAGGLVFLPYLNGERTPNLPGGCGVLYGARTGNLTAPNIARAAVEGATLGLAYGLRRFKELGVEPEEIRLTGGGSKSAVWRQMTADAFGVPVVGLATSEGAGLGAAIQAAFCYQKHAGAEVGYEELTTLCVDLDRQSRCEPDASNAALYQDQLDKQLELTRTLARAGLL
ncbi:xylulokinase [soil metagenome]